MNLALTRSAGLLITAVFTLLTPLAAKADLYFLYAVRIIEVKGRICCFHLYKLLLGSGRGGHLSSHVRHARQVERAT